MSLPPASAGESYPANGSRKVPFFFREENSNLIVKGNFMTLSAKPEYVEKGEWLAHQVVEQNRLLQHLLSVIQEVDAKTGQAVCNTQTCPTMSAAEFTYTWLDNKGNPVKIPAYQYIQLVQKWIRGKFADQKLFPTDTSLPAVPSRTPAAINNHDNQSTATTNGSAVAASVSGEWLGKASGFPSTYEYDIKSLYRQMFRCYAHLYYGHWLEPFYHLGAYKELNTCFIHFINVGKLFDLLADKDLKPMQPLIDIWQAKGLLPPRTSTTPAAA